MPLHPATSGLVHDYLQDAGHVDEGDGARFYPVGNSQNGALQKALTPDSIHKMATEYSTALGFEIGAHALRTTAATNALDNQAGIAMVQEWRGHANTATTRISDHRNTRPEDSPTFKVIY